MHRTGSRPVRSASAQVLADKRQTTGIPARFAREAEVGNVAMSRLQLSLPGVSHASPPISSNGERRVAIVTGGPQGMGAGIVDAFRDGGYAVVATARSIPPVDEPYFMTVAGDIAEAETARRVVEQTIERFGSIDTL